MQTQFALVLMTLLLGIQHGYDIDHLAVIDSATNSIHENQLLSKMVGLLFSLGHGLVVVILSLIIGSGIVQMKIPSQLEIIGNSISILFLLLFGLLNLRKTFSKPCANQTPSSIRRYLIYKLSRQHLHGVWIIIIGGLFALSFDTFSQVFLFSMVASTTSGWLFSGILGIAFMTGMIITDGLNGLLIAAAIHYANKAAWIMSRIVGLVVALFSLSTGMVGLIRLTCH